MTGAVLQHLRIAREFARIGVIRKSQLRVEFAAQVLMDCVWYASHVLVFEILFGHAGSIASWRHEDVRVLLGFLFVSDAFMMIWLGQAWRFGRDLKNGELDPVRVRPGHPAFLYFFQSFSVEGCANMAFAAGYLGWGIARSGTPLGWELALVVPAAVALAFWARTVTLVLFAAAEFWLVGSDAANFINRLFDASFDRPLDVFGARTRAFLLYAVPVGAMTHLPAQAVLGRLDLPLFAASAAWLVLLGLGVFALWSRGFRRYESALG